ncbi:MAG: FGGY family carbohydrate kinase [Steroidobacteraceae bacterium]
MSTRAVLALDQGGHASRACLVGADGDLIATHQVAIATARGADGSVEHDAEEIVASLRTAAAAVLEQAPSIVVEAAGLAVQRSTIVCFETASGAPLSAAISWQDRRNDSWLHSFHSHAARIRALTGLPLSAHYGVGKMRWCLDNLPAVQRARARQDLKIAPLAAWLARRLTGEGARVDPASASRTLLWDSARRDWSDELLGLFGIERAWLCACASTRDDYGRLQLGAAPGSLAHPLRLKAVTGDQSAIPFAFGAPDLKSVYVNLGTGAFIQCPLSQRPQDPTPLLGSVLYADREHAIYSLEGTVNGAGAALSAFAADNAVAEEQLWQRLEQLAPETPLPLYVNGIGGLGSPYWRAQQRSYFLGEGGLIERFAAVVESIVFLIAINFELLQRHGPSPQRVLVSGGLARSRWLCQRLAVALSTPVEVGATEASVLGVAALADPSCAWRERAQRSPIEPGSLPDSVRADLSARRAGLEEALRRSASQP